MNKIVGKELISYVNKQGKDVNGIRIHFLNDNNTKVKGFECDSFYISSVATALFEKMEKIELNVAVNIYYNKFGNVENVEVVK